MIDFACPACNAAMSHNIAGNKIPCPQCGQRVQVPAPVGNKTKLGVLPAPVQQVPIEIPVPDQPTTRCWECGTAIRVSEAVREFVIVGYSSGWGLDRNGSGRSPGAHYQRVDLCQDCSAAKQLPPEKIEASKPGPKPKAPHRPRVVVGLSLAAGLVIAVVGITAFLVIFLQAL
jgi:hypothetical protein